MSRSLRNVFTRAARVRVQTALNPLLWLCAVATPASYLAAWGAGFQSTVGILLAIVGALPIAAAVIAYAVFAIRDPDRLQSEEYLLRQQEILILSKSGEAKDPTKLDLKPNPQMDNASPGGENG